MDFATLSYVQAGMLVINMIVMLIAWRMNPVIPGPRLWVAGSIIMMISSVLIAIFIQVYQISIISVSASLIGNVGYFLYYAGLCQFHRVKPKTGLFIGFTFLMAILLFFGTYGTDDPKFWRVWVGSFGIGLLSIFIASHYYIIVHRSCKPVDIFLIIIFGGVGTIWNMRAVMTLLEHPATDGYFRPIDIIAFYVTIFFLASMAMGMVLKIAGRLQEHWKRQAVTDPLTGIFNRRGFSLMAHPMIRSAKRNKKSVVVSIIDLDHFKRINDDFGHDTGDKVLLLFSNTMVDSIRSRDLVGRLGGEEFVILFPEVDIGDAQKILARISNDFKAKWQHVKGLTRAVSISAGISVSKSDAIDLDKLILRADMALLNAKKNGRDRIEIA